MWTTIEDRLRIRRSLRDRPRDRCRSEVLRGAVDAAHSRLTGANNFEAGRVVDGSPISAVRASIR